MHISSSAAKVDFHQLSNADQRLYRHLREAKRLRLAFLSLALGHPAVRGVCDDHRTTGVFAEQGFQPHDVCALRLTIVGKSIVAIAIPHRIWFRPGKMHRVLEAKRVAKELGIACVLVPEGAVRQQPRLENCESISSNMELTVTATDRMRVMQHLIDAGGSSSLADCSAFVAHDNPIDAVLAMIASKQLAIDVDSPLMPHTTVEIANRSP